MEDKKINLQLFAEDGDMEYDLAPDNDEEFNVDSLFEIDEENAEDEAKEDEPKTDEEPQNEENTQRENVEQEQIEVKQENIPEPERKFTQEDVDRIITERLARDRKSQLVKELESLVGMDISGIVEYARKQKVSQKAEEMGISEEEAERILMNEEEIQETKRRMQEYEQQLQAFQNVLLYGQEKSKYISNPLVKKYEKEIDDFAKGGLQCSFVPAMNFVLGQKVLSGEITKEMQNAAEQKTLANISKRSKIAVEKANGELPNETYLTAEEKQIAARLGLTYKEYAEEKARLKK